MAPSKVVSLLISTGAAPPSRDYKNSKSHPFRKSNDKKLYHIMIYLEPTITLILLKLGFSTFSTCLKAHSDVSSRECPSYAYIVAIYIYILSILMICCGTCSGIEKCHGSVWPIPRSRPSANTSYGVLLPNLSFRNRRGLRRGGGVKKKATSFYITFRMRLKVEWQEFTNRMSALNANSTGFPVLK